MAGYDKEYRDMVAAKRAARANRPPPEPEPEPEPEPGEPDEPVEVQQPPFMTAYPRDGGGSGPS